jgi:hypothetical protein
MPGVARQALSAPRRLHVEERGRLVAALMNLYGCDPEFTRDLEQLI